MQERNTVVRISNRHHRDLRGVSAYVSMYGIRAPGAESVNPATRFMRQQEASLYLFIGGSNRLGCASKASAGSAGEPGALFSRSHASLAGVVGVNGPLGGSVEAPGTETETEAAAAAATGGEVRSRSSILPLPR